MQFYSAALMKMLVPLTLIGAALLGRLYIDQLGSDARVILDNLAYLFCLVALFMAYQFNRSRLMLASFGVVIFYWVVQNYLQASLSDPIVWGRFLAISLALPILILYLLLLPERGIWNLYGFVFSLAFIMLALICVQLGPWLPQVSEAAQSYYAPRPVDGYVLSFGATLLAGLVVVVGIALLTTRNEEVDAALIGTFCSPLSSARLAASGAHFRGNVHCGSSVFALGQLAQLPCDGLPG